MGKPKPLTPEDNALIHHFNEIYSSLFDIIERAKKFKVDDYLILFVSDDGKKYELKKNSYGAPIKYKVVHINADGIAFVKQTNKKGDPVGRVFSCVGTEVDTYREHSQTFKFELDPDYADAILLQDEKYDPAQLHRSKKEIWKAVTDHNKACKVVTATLKDVIDFFGTVNSGDMLWTSNNGHFVVQDKRTMSPVEFNNRKPRFGFHTRMKGPLIVVLSIVDKSGKVKDITADFFLHKALYKERPRSYKELNI